MTIKNLFGNHSSKIINETSLEEIEQEVESEGFLSESTEDKERFIPHVDFSDPANFAFFGSAERYYIDSITNIYSNYPYDGSKKEKLEFHNKNTPFDKYVFENIYPKTTGYINLDSNLNQYVVIKGGPNVDTSSTQLTTYDKDNFYDALANRTSNLKFDPVAGNTVEFWFKNNLPDSSYCLFDLWNRSELRFSIKKNGTDLLITYKSGSDGIEATIPYTLTDTWQHYAFSVKNSDSNINLQFFVNGKLYSNILDGTSINSEPSWKDLIAYIGKTVDGDEELVDGSFDEFRFWKEARSEKNIARYWFTNVDGGANTDNSNTELGVYYKFNEGVVSDSNYDSVVLDYSGRISNGQIVNYDSSVRSTSSAIDEYFSEEKEEKAPIINPINSLVSDVIDTYGNIGAVYDQTNNANFLNSLPAWIVEEAEDKELHDVKYLTQILSSYLDNIYLGIKSLNKLKDINYTKEGDKPYPFARNILSSHGLEVEDLFNDTTIIEDLLSRNENEEYEQKLYNIKNTIYQNIYNNLVHIYKSKGTEQSIRNLIRSFGVDDELLKLNVYSNNAEIELNDKKESKTIIKKFVDFNNDDRFEATVYQATPLAGSNSNEFDSVPFTMEAEVLFPKREDYIPVTPSFISSSLFGIHEDDLVSDSFNFQVYAVKQSLSSKDAKFVLKSDGFGESITLETDTFKDVYDNSKWNFAVRIKPANYDKNSVNTSSYSLEFYCVNAVSDKIQNSSSLSFELTDIPSVKTALNCDKRIYVGAHYNNFVASLLDKTDVKISSVRFWKNYLNNETVDNHAKDASSFGISNPTQLTSFDEELNSETILLNWDFSNVTSSDDFGNFTVSNRIGSTNYGIGHAFPANSSEVVSKEHIYIVKNKAPEYVSSADMVKIPDSESVKRVKDFRTSNVFLSLEKGISQVINDEILNWFSTIKDYSNLIGKNVDRYSSEYKELDTLRHLFFEKVNNEPSFEKFSEYYKWIDSSVGRMVSQLFPATSDFNGGTPTVIESHILERNKYENKLPTVGFKERTFSSVMTRNFNSSADSIAGGLLWSKSRAVRTETGFDTPTESQNDENREVLRKIIYSQNNDALSKLYDSSSANTYRHGELVKFNSKAYNLRGVSSLVNVSQSHLDVLTSEPIDMVSVENVQDENYTMPYEVWQTNGRKENNKYFVEKEGNIASIVTSSYISGALELIYSDRTAFKNIFVNRFSAPGGPETSGRSGLDHESGEYSIYNALNYRNLIVRDELDVWNAESSSISDTAPSFHKFNKNIRRDAEGTASYDNAFVVRQIPQSDGQYSWINSALKTRPSASGYMSNYPNLNIYTSIDIPGYTSASISWITGAVFNSIKYDFVGTSMLVSKSVDLDNNTVSPSSSFSASLNEYLLNLNGKYNFASWIVTRRNTDNILVRYHKKNNILSIEDSNSESFTNYVEPPVTYNKPMKAVLSVSGSEEPVELTFAHQNNKDILANQELSIRVGKLEREDETYDNLKSFINDKTIEPAPELIKITQKDVVFPRKEKVGLADVRSKPDYDDSTSTGNLTSTRTFWRDSYINRKRIDKGYSIFDYHSSSYAAMGNFTSSILGMNSPVVHIVSSSTLPFANSIWELDSLTGSAYTGSAELRASSVLTESLSITASYGDHVLGALAPYKLPEHRYFISQPAGTYKSGRNQDNVVMGVFNYSNERIIPRPQLFFTNHQPASSGSYTIEYAIDRDNIDVLIHAPVKQSKIFTINDGYQYETDTVSGKKPFYDSYSEYFYDIKPVSKEYSIIPEYRFDNVAEFYIKENNSNFNQIYTSSYLTLDGNESDFEDINTKVNTTDILKSDIFDDFSGSTKQFNLKLSGVKKMLPYRGFYPAERIVQVSEKFVNSFFKTAPIKVNTSTDSGFYDSDCTNGTNAYGTSGSALDQQLLTVMQPLFAPGILMNTIKSSIAVDWATFLTSSVQYSSSTKPNFYNTSSYSASAANELFYTIDQTPNYRFPFESLIELDTIIPKELRDKVLYYLDPTYYGYDIFSGSDRNNIRYPSYKLSENTSSYKSFSFMDNDYKLAMHNLLAEIPNFFLKDKKLTGFVSKPESEFLTVTSGTAYYMDISIEKPKQYSSYISDKFHKLVNKFFKEADGIYNYIYTTLDEDSIYGPPMRYYWDNISGALGNGGFINNDYILKSYLGPAYAAYTPPYYYGKSVCRVSFRPTDTRKYSLDEILNNLSYEFINEEADNVFYSASLMVSSQPSSYTSSPAYQSLMKLTSSINLKQKVDIKKTQFDSIGNLTNVGSGDSSNFAWSIQTKYETPSINFSSVSSPVTKIVGGNSSSYAWFDVVTSQTFKGLWTSYGQPVTQQDAIKFSIEESYDYTNKNDSGSLINVCGFRKESKPIGLLGEKEISEAVVVIPYTMKDNHTNIDNEKALTIPEILGENGIYSNDQRGTGPYYFGINRETIKELIGLDFSPESNITYDNIKNKLKLTNNKNSILDTMKKMTEYNLPPNLDWLRNKKINPFVMYVFEFKEQLSKEDLSDIWQNVLPERLRNAQIENIEIKHPLNENEMFHGKKFPKDVRFKIFKIKKRANINYYELTEDSSDDTKFKFKFGNQTVTPDYSYNYPYDYFSMVELAKLEAGLEAGLEVSKEENNTEEKKLDRAKDKLQSKEIIENKLNISSIKQEVKMKQMKNYLKKAGK